MAAGAAAAEEAPALAGFLLGLTALLVVGFLIAVRHVWIYTVGAILEDLGHLLRIDTFGIHWHPGDKLIDIDHAVQNWIVDAETAADGGVAYLFHASAVLAEWGIRELEHWTAESLAWAEWFQHVHLPRWVKWAIAATVPPYLIYKIARTAVSAALPSVLRAARAMIRDSTALLHGDIRPLERDLDKAWHRLRALEAEISKVAGGHIHVHAPGVLNLPGVWRGLTRRAARIERRLARLEALLGATGLAVAMANVLGLPNARCLRNGNIGRLSRFLCGMDGRLLDMFLLGAFEAAVVTDLCDFATLLSKTTEAARPALMGFVDVENALIACPSASFPNKVTPPELDLASAVPVVNL